MPDLIFANKEDMKCNIEIHAPLGSWEDLKQYCNDMTKQWDMFKTRLLETENDCPPREDI